MLSKDERDELRALLEGITALPWRECGGSRDDGPCSCGMVWSTEEGVPVHMPATLTDADIVPVLEVRKRNAAYIARACSMMPGALDTIDALAARVRELEATLDHRGTFAR